MAEVVWEIEVIPTDHYVDGKQQFQFNIPPWCDWMAIDANGDVYMYQLRPEVDVAKKQWMTGPVMTRTMKVGHMPGGCIHWQNTLKCFKNLGDH